MTNKNIGIFRKQYLPITETFIAEQGYGLPEQSTAKFIGLREHKNGLHHVQRDDFLSLSSSKFDYSLGKAQIRLAKSFPQITKLPGRWINKAARSDIQLLHSHFGHTGLVGMQLAQALNIPHVVTFHGHDIAPLSLSDNYLQRLPELWNSASTIIAVSEHIKNKLLERGAPENKVQVHYIGINTERFTPDPAARSAQPSVLFVGRLVEKKGIADLIAAMQRVQSKQPDVKLVVIGSGPEQEKLELAARDGLNVELLGAQQPDRIRQELNKAWVFCGPSCANSKGDEEGLGMVFLEAQACGTPVVSCHTGGIPEAVDDGKTGILVNANSPDELATALLELLQDDGLRQQMADDAFTWINSRFEIKAQCKKLDNIYQIAISTHEY